MIRFRLPPPCSLPWTKVLGLALLLGHPGLSLHAEHAAAGGAAHPAESPAETPAHPANVHAPAVIETAPAKKASGPAEPKSTAAKAKAADHGPSAEPDSALVDEEVRSMIKLGGSMADKGDYDAAEIAFRHVLKTRGASLTDTKSALLGLARMHRKQGGLTKAAAIYEKYLKEFPGDERTPEALLDLGRTLRALGVYDMAISRFYSVINSTLKLPSDGFEHYQQLARTAQFEIAETHFQAGRFDEAAKFFGRLRLLDLADVDRARAHFKSAFSQQRQGDNENAVSTLRAFIAQWPDDENIPEARYLLAVSLRALNRRQEALAATFELLRTEKARVDLNPKLWAHWQRLTGNQLANDFYESGDLLNAQAIYAALAELSTDPVWRLPVLYQVGLCHERLGNLDRARSTYQSIIDTAGTGATGDAAELARMAAWRLNNLNWNEKAGREISSLFENTTGKAAPVPTLPPGAKTAAIPATP